jgi:ABC-type thiamine transport system substrate-binding protein
MKKTTSIRTSQWALALATTGCLMSTTATAQSGEVNVICSAQAAWCSMIAVTFEKSQGVKVNMTLKGSGEAIAQILAEKANPKTDVWFGGTGDPHLQAAEQNLTLEYKSPTLPKLHKPSNLAIKQSVSIRAPWDLVTTPSCWPRKSWPFRKLGMTCSNPNTKAKFNRPIHLPVVRLTP